MLISIEIRALILLLVLMAVLLLGIAVMVVVLTVVVIVPKIRKGAGKSRYGVNGMENIFFREV